jgi:hypothetical protein
MPIAEKVAALLEAVTLTDVQALPPCERRRFADLCRHMAALAERTADTPRSGVLYELCRDRAHH